MAEQSDAARYVCARCGHSARLHDTKFGRCLRREGPDGCGCVDYIERVIPPGKWDTEADALFIDKAREATREQDQP